jgi:hypothetical protein
MFSNSFGGDRSLVVGLERAGRSTAGATLGVYSGYSRGMPLPEQNAHTTAPLKE